ncbi:Hachiman antiphage defense system protein HamA [Bartonella sp. HY761]|uniref:Hachiman antiphage defense system protein HamA n=1 Tax=Bartonella sp. HY761 TaxID=2979330 RepID=UPI002206BB6D|nr:Hachiman antiphage defense system protein HamA [Bartonella sp. HY761]UXN06207.1 virulence associated protein [Bartonella sp. HY761]
MPWTNAHLAWLRNTGETIIISTGECVPIYEFAYDVRNQVIMSSWAKHFRNHYCLDNEIDILKPPGMTNSDYLLSLKFPDSSPGLGPSTRSGDFSEILVVDFLTYLSGYYVPRTRYDRKIIGNESAKGSDVLGFKQENTNPSPKDELLVYEVKARLSENNVANTLQIAIDDSLKDGARLAESLNGAKQRLFDQKDIPGMQKITRFQQNVDLPYKTKFGAAAVLTNSSCCAETLAKSSTQKHPSQSQLEMIVIRGPLLMSLVHSLYERAANEA